MEQLIDLVAMTTLLHLDGGGGRGVDGGSEQRRWRRRIRFFFVSFRFSVNRFDLFFYVNIYVFVM